MKVSFRHYDPRHDFVPIRDMLSETYAAYGKPLNWRIERWNWARYHPFMFSGDAEANIRLWEGAAGVWEDGSGEIVGVAHLEPPWHGEAFFQRRPGHDALLPAMLDYAEANLFDRVKASLLIHILADDEPVRKLAAARGYQQDAEHPEYDSEYVITGVPAVDLPPGHAVQSMAEGGDPALRCKVQGLGFDHPDPAEWMTPSQYRRVQQAPDYRADLDLVVRGPDSEYLACCIVWYDARNKLGVFEPVCTHAGFRRRGFGRAVIMEGIRRVAALGATRAQVGSGQPFYTAIGFQKKWVSHRWTKQLAVAGGRLDE